MFKTIPGRERRFSVCPVLVAIPALIPNIVQPNDHCGGEVELLHGTDLALKGAKVCVPAAQKCSCEPGCNAILTGLKSARLAYRSSG
jgi:hypothetical protein